MPPPISPKGTPASISSFSISSSPSSSQLYPVFSCFLTGDVLPLLDFSSSTLHEIYQPPFITLQRACTDRNISFHIPCHIYPAALVAWVEVFLEIEIVLGLVARVEVSLCRTHSLIHVTLNPHAPPPSPLLPHHTLLFLPIIILRC